MNQNKIQNINYPIKNKERNRSDQKIETTMKLFNKSDHQTERNDQFQKIKDFKIYDPL